MENNVIRTNEEKKKPWKFYFEEEEDVKMLRCDWMGCMKNERMVLMKSFEFFYWKSVIQGETC